MNNNIFKHVRIPERLKELKEKFDFNCIFDHEKKTLTYKNIIQIAQYNILLEFYKDYKIDVIGDIWLDGQDLNSIDIKFNKVKGSFLCSFNNLISLKNCPEEVSESFYCHRNKLETLEYCPKIVKKGFYCYDNFKKFTIEEVKEKCKVSGMIYIKLIKWKEKKLN